MKKLLQEIKQCSVCSNTGSEIRYCPLGKQSKIICDRIRLPAEWCTNRASFSNDRSGEIIQEVGCEWIKLIFYDTKNLGSCAHGILLSGTSKAATCPRGLNGHCCGIEKLGKPNNQHPVDCSYRVQAHRIIT